MMNLTSQPMSASEGLPPSELHQHTAEALAQALMAKLTITDKDWHRLKTNRQARASEQAIAALVFLLKNQPDEALPRLQQAVNWLDHSVSAPPCETHGK